LSSNNSARCCRNETLRHETRLFSALNCWLLVGLVFLGTGYVVFLHSPRLQLMLGDSSYWLDRLSFWALTFFALLPWP